MRSLAITLALLLGLTLLAAPAQASPGGYCDEGPGVDVDCVTYHDDGRKAWCGVYVAIPEGGWGCVFIQDLQ